MGVEETTTAATCTKQERAPCIAEKKLLWRRAGWRCFFGQVRRNAAHGTQYREGEKAVVRDHRRDKSQETATEMCLGWPTEVSTRPALGTSLGGRTDRTSDRRVSHVGPDHRDRPWDGRSCPQDTRGAGTSARGTPCSPGRPCSRGRPCTRGPCTCPSGQTVAGSSCTPAGSCSGSSCPASRGTCAGRPVGSSQRASCGRRGRAP
mmetsp:Transcript_9290/g.15976  ORF Transcript_9290/g.15976 Transcript_9290/m.15976 type:complete len:205 (-) Transcript_9290:569-1183(-)